MLTRLFVIATFLILFQFGCKPNSSKIREQLKEDSTEDETFFPVTEYIKGQLKQMDSLPITPLKIIDTNGKQDSVWIKKENIRAFAEPFLHPQIDSANFKNLFASKSFLDQTINAFTFSYDPVGKLPDTLQLRRWDIYIDPQKNAIKRIYIVKELKDNGTSQKIQLTWKSGQWCKITTIIEEKNKQTYKREETMKWDFSE